MRKRFFFRRPSKFAFDMVVTINDDRHEANFIASMVRKGYEVVDFASYMAECVSMSQFKHKRLSYGRRP